MDLGNSGRDAREVLRAAIRAGESALTLGSRDIRTYDGLATAYWYLSQQETSHGKDGEGPLRSALEILERGKQVDASDPFVFRNLGVIHGIRAEICFRKGYTQAHFNLGNSLTMQALMVSGRGGDPGEVIVQADAALGRALELNSASADFWDQRGVVRNLSAAYKLHCGEDPLPEVEQALKHFEAALQRNPNMPQAMVHKAEAAVRTPGRPWKRC
jgi:tetratricopeptide (TPR) repeat protein